MVELHHKPNKVNEYEVIVKSKPITDSNETRTLDLPGECFIRYDACSFLA